MPRRLGGVVSSRAGRAASRRTARWRRRGRRRRPRSTSRRRPPDEQAAADGRPDEHADLHPERRQRVGRGDLVVRARCAASSASREGRCSDDAAASSAPTTKITQTLRVRRNALTASTAVSSGLRDAGPDQQPAPVHVVGQRAAVQPEDDQRDQLDEADRADREVGAGQRVDLVRDGDVGRPSRRGRTRCRPGTAAGSRATPAAAWCRLSAAPDGPAGSSRPEWSQTAGPRGHRIDAWRG